MASKKISVFNYTDFRSFLGDYYSYQKKNSPVFSYRYFAQQAGFSSHNVLKLVIAGERNIANKSIYKYIKALKLSKREADYFRTLVEFNQTDNEVEKKECLEKLFEFKEGAKTRKLTELQYKLFTEWHHSAVRELISCGVQTPKEISDRIAPPIGKKTAKESVELLLDLELIKKNKNGLLQQVDKSIETPPELDSFVVREYNRSMIELAKRSIGDISRSRREVSGMTLGISQKRFELMKEKIQLFKEELLQDVLTDDEESELVYQLNFQLFPLINEEKRL